MKKYCLTLGLIVLILCLLPLSTQAVSAETMPDGYSAMEEYLPEEVGQLLPDGLFSDDPQEALSAAETLTRPEYLFRVVWEAVGLRLKDVLSLFLFLVGVVFLSALLRRLSEALTGSGEGVCFSLRLSIYALIILRAASMVDWIKTYFSQLITLMTGFLPVMGTLYALGGNVTAAAANEGILLLFFGICDYLTAAITPAVCGISMAFALLNGFGSSLQVSFAHLGGMIKKWYTGFLGFLMFLLGVALSLQSVLAAGADSLSMKGIKYAVGQMIPVVGGAVSGTLGTVAAGVSMLRGVSGVCGLILVGLLLLPTLVQLLLFRACYRTAATVASTLGCSQEAGLLEEMGSLYGYMIAATAICSLVCVLSLSIFAHGGTAL